MSTDGRLLGLVGDIGGTNARFALAFDAPDGLVLRQAASVRCADFPSLEAAIDGYLAESSGPRPAAAALAIAGPVNAGVVKMTNLPWRVSEAALAEAGLSIGRLLNDYEALALAFGDPRRRPSSASIGPEILAQADRPLLVMGAGTGFGLAGLIFTDGRPPQPLPGEAGHVGLAPADELEVEIWRRLTIKFGRASIERVLSGPGLSNLHEVLTGLDGQADNCLPEEVSARAEDGDASAMRTVEVFFTLLARAAGDFALTYGAFGGVYLSGGVVGRLAGRLDASAFRNRFEDKGRFRDYMRAIPTRLITDPSAALIGAANALAHTR